MNRTMLTVEQLCDRIVPALFALDDPTGMFSISPSTPPETGAEYNTHFTHIETDGDDKWFTRVTLVSGPDTAFARIKPGDDRFFQVGSSEPGLLIVRVTVEDSSGEVVDNFAEITAKELFGISPPPPASPPVVPPPPAVPPTSPPPAVPPVAPPPAMPGPISGQYNHGITAVSDIEVALLDPHGQTIDWFNPGASSVRAVAADVTGDGVPDIVTVAGPGNLPSLWIYDGASNQKIFDQLVFEESFRGGLLVSAGDIDADGSADIVVTPDEGGGPRVRVYQGGSYKILADYFGIDDPKFRGGARTAVGDLNKDGHGDIIVAAGFGGGPRVAFFDGAWLQERRKLTNDIFVFEPGLRNGVYVGVGDINGDGVADAIFGAGPGGGPRVRVLDGHWLIQGKEDELANFFAGKESDRNGVRVTGKDLDGDQFDDLVTSSESWVRAYRGSTLELKWQRDPFDAVTRPIFVG